MPNRAECIGVIMAGGASTRMGTDKSNLLWHGVPLHTHLRALLKQAGAQRVVLSGRAELDGGIADTKAHLGPIIGLASVFAALAQERAWLLVLAIDMPRLQPETLQTLMPSHDQDYRCFDAHPLPLGLRMSEKTRQLLNACAAEADPAKRALRHWLAQLRGESLPTSPELRWQLQSANTPQQWQALQ